MGKSRERDQSDKQRRREKGAGRFGDSSPTASADAPHITDLVQPTNNEIESATPVKENDPPDDAHELVRRYNSLPRELQTKALGEYIANDPEGARASADRWDQLFQQYPRPEDGTSFTPDVFSWARREGFADLPSLGELKMHRDLAETLAADARRAKAAEEEGEAKEQAKDQKSVIADPVQDAAADSQPEPLVEATLSPNDAAQSEDGTISPGRLEEVADPDERIADIPEVEGDLNSEPTPALDALLQHVKERQRIKEIAEANRQEAAAVPEEFESHDSLKMQRDPVYALMTKIMDDDTVPQPIKDRLFGFHYRTVVPSDEPDHVQSHWSKNYHDVLKTRAGLSEDFRTQYDTGEFDWAIGGTWGKLDLFQDKDIWAHFDDPDSPLGKYGAEMHALRSQIKDEQLPDEFARAVARGEVSADPVDPFEHIPQHEDHEDEDIDNDVETETRAGRFKKLRRLVAKVGEYTGAVAEYAGAKETAAAKKYLEDRSHELDAKTEDWGEKSAAFVHTIGEWYNKRSIKTKFVIGASLTLGATVSSAGVASALLGAITIQRSFAGVGMVSRIARDIEAKRAATPAEQQSGARELKEFAARTAAALFITFGIGAALRETAHLVNGTSHLNLNSIRDWLSSDSVLNHHVAAVAPESTTTTFDTTTTTTELPTTTMEVPAATIHQVMPVPEAIPEAPVMHGDIPGAASVVSPEHIVTAAPSVELPHAIDVPVAHQSLEINFPEAEPAVNVPHESLAHAMQLDSLGAHSAPAIDHSVLPEHGGIAQPQSFAEFSPEAAAASSVDMPHSVEVPQYSVAPARGRGYEDMAYKLWRQLHDAKNHFDPSTIKDPNSDIAKLWNAKGGADIKQVVHELAKQHGFFSEATGESVLIKPGTHASFGADYNIHVADPAHADVVHAPTGAHVTAAPHAPAPVAAHAAEAPTAHTAAPVSAEHAPSPAHTEVAPAPDEYRGYSSKQDYVDSMHRLESAYHIPADQHLSRAVDGHFHLTDAAGHDQIFNPETFHSSVPHETATPPEVAVNMRETHGYRNPDGRLYVLGNNAALVDAQAQDYALKHNVPVFVDKSYKFLGIIDTPRFVEYVPSKDGTLAQVIHHGPSYVPDLKKFTKRVF